MRPSSWRAECCIVASMSLCSGSSLVRAISEPMPITLFSGVLSSWLMIARNRVFAALASSANALAAVRRRTNVAA